jgi:hypothetical protein
VIRENRELLAELARLNNAMASLALRGPGQNATRVEAHNQKKGEVCTRATWVGG